MVTKTELQAMYEVMFTDYPDIVNVAQVQSMLGTSANVMDNVLTLPESEAVGWQT